MLERKCLASASETVHSLISSGGVSGVDKCIFPLRQQKPGVSNSNFFGWHISIDLIIRIQHIRNTVNFIIKVDFHINFIFFIYIEY
jgi:hypothetical protein